MEFTLDFLPDVFEHPFSDELNPDISTFRSYMTVCGEQVFLHLSRRDGRWKAESDEIIAVLSLWLYSAHSREHSRGGNQKVAYRTDDAWLRAKGTPYKPCLQLLGTHTPGLYQDLKWWMPDGAVQVIAATPSPKKTRTEVEAHRVVGFESAASFKRTDDEAESVWCEASAALFACFGDHTNGDTDGDFSSDLSFLRLGVGSDHDTEDSTTSESKDNTDSGAEGESEDRTSHNVQNYVHGGKAGLDTSQAFFAESLRPMGVFGIHGLQTMGLGTLEETYLTILPPLSTYNKLPRADSVVEWTRKHAIEHERLGQWAETTRMHARSFYMTKSHSQNHLLIKATALLMDCVRALERNLAINRGQLIYKDDFDDKPLAVLIRKIERELRTVDPKTWKRLYHLFGFMGRLWKQPLVPVAYDKDLSDDDKNVLHVNNSYGCLY
ncbi:hypothetical protein QBC35DRAFT_455828 [Podospora australis]|uniref:Uncharacterized protein n=1 Tax=Podospora australis TaxID=1536484 RepID=A0AAN6WKP5_9PEZI|nr:hypothetical protein QBC35DRAFT_455828 [Podospora australis]